MVLDVSIPIYFIDFEGSLASGILEYGIVSLEGTAIKATTSQLCAPKGRITTHESKYHHLTAEQLAACPPFIQAWSQFVQLRQSGVFAAHHATVENAFLRATWPCAPISRHFLSPGRPTYDWGPWIDTYQIYYELFPQLKTYKLQTLIQFSGLQTKLDALARQHCPPERCSYHCALYDALAGALLLLQLPALVESRLDLPWLLIQSCPSLAKRQQLEQMYF